MIETRDACFCLPFAKTFKQINTYLATPLLWPDAFSGESIVINFVSVTHEIMTAQFLSCSFSLFRNQLKRYLKVLSWSFLLDQRASNYVVMFWRSDALWQWPSIWWSLLQTFIQICMSVLWCNQMWRAKTVWSILTYVAEEKCTICTRVQSLWFCVLELTTEPVFCMQWCSQIGRADASWQRLSIQ